MAPPFSTEIWLMICRQVYLTGLEFPYEDTPKAIYSLRLVDKRISQIATPFTFREVVACKALRSCRNIASSHLQQHVRKAIVDFWGRKNREVEPDDHFESYEPLTKSDERRLKTTLMSLACLEELDLWWDRHGGDHEGEDYCIVEACSGSLLADALEIIPRVRVLRMCVAPAFPARLNLLKKAQKFLAKLVSFSVRIEDEEAGYGDAQNTFGDMLKYMGRLQHLEIRGPELDYLGFMSLPLPSEQLVSLSLHTVAMCGDELSMIIHGNRHNLQNVILFSASLSSGNWENVFVKLQLTKQLRRLSLNDLHYGRDALEGEEILNFKTIKELIGRTHYSPEDGGHDMMWAIQPKRLRDYHALGDLCRFIQSSMPVDSHTEFSQSRCLQWLPLVDVDTDPTLAGEKYDWSVWPHD